MSIPEINVVPWKPDSDTHSRIYVFSVDLCKQETWYVDSTYVSGEALGVGDGITTEFELAHGSGDGEAIVDLSHGKVTDEILIAPPGGEPGGYVPVIEVDEVALQEREVYETTGGDYEIDYISGKVTFFIPPASGDSIVARYYYVPASSGPVITGGPPAGKKWIIDAAEAQFTTDVIITDTLVQNVILDYPVFDGSGNYLYTINDMKGTTDALYYNVGSYLDFSWGSHPIIPAFGGSERGLQNPTIIMRWNYLAPIELKSSLNMRIKVWTKHGRGYEGERATVALYGLEVDE